MPLRKAPTLAALSTHPGEDIDHFILVHTVLICLRWGSLWWEIAAEETQPLLSLGLRYLWLEFLCDELLPPMEVNYVRKRSNTGREHISLLSFHIFHSGLFLFHLLQSFRRSHFSLHRGARCIETQKNTFFFRMTGKNIIQGFWPVPLYETSWPVC